MKPQSSRTVFLVASFGALASAACGSSCLQCRSEAASASPAATGRRLHGNPAAVQVTSVDSSSVTLRWPSDVRSIEIFLGPEPPADDGTLPDESRVAKLDGETRAHTVEGLAASTHVFLRVEMHTGQGEVRQETLHARTDGGPGASLATPVRAVHAYGPDVLALVMANPEVRYEDGELQGSNGEDWQGDTWSVHRHDGTRVPVESVHRHSLPVAQPKYEVGFDQYGTDEVVDVDHWIFLELGESLGHRDVFRVVHEGPPSLEVRVPYSDRYLVTPLVQLNQLGYNPRASRRWAYVSGWMGDGGTPPLSELPDRAEVVVEPTDPLAPRDGVVAEVPVTQRRKEDAEAGGPVYAIDLSEVPAAEGVRYRIRIPGIGVSWPTAISEEAALRAFWSVARGLYLNRWCGKLDEAHTEWSRPPDHCRAYFTEGRPPKKGKFPRDTPRTNEKPLVGGHHDAGDFDIRPFHVVVAQYLMRAFEMHPKRFTDGQLAIPESGNGIPDLLDEALWSIAAWEALQNEDGSVRAGVESYKHPPGIYFAHRDELPYWTFDPVPWHTAYVAALFAQGARLAEPFDAERAKKLRSRARRAYEWAEGRDAPTAYRLYAASELFALTGEARYEDDFRSCWKELDKYGRGAFDHVVPMIKIYDGAFGSYSPAMADFVMGYVQSEGADEEIIEVVREQLTERANGAADSILDSRHGHRVGLGGDPSHTWGKATSTGRHADMIYQRLELGGLSDERRQRYVDALSVAADYALGANPAGYSWISGLGSRHPLHPLHLDSLAFQKKQDMQPIPGLPVFGPVDGFPGAHYYAAIGAAFHPPYNEHPPGNRVSDTRASVMMNEFTVWAQQAPMALLFASLLGPDALPPDAWEAGGEAHHADLPSHRSSSVPDSRTASAGDDDSSSGSDG